MFFLTLTWLPWCCSSSSCFCCFDEPAGHGTGFLLPGGYFLDVKCFYDTYLYSQIVCKVCVCACVLKYCDQNRLYVESDPTAQTRQKLRDNPEIHAGEIDHWLWEDSVISQTVSQQHLLQWCLLYFQPNHICVLLSIYYLNMSHNFF